MQDFTKTQNVEVFCKFSGKVSKIANYILGYTDTKNFLMENDSFKPSIDYINDQINKTLCGRYISSIRTIDEALQDIKIDEKDPLKGINIINNLSLLIAKTFSICKEIPLYKSQNY